MNHYNNPHNNNFNQNNVPQMGRQPMQPLYGQQVNNQGFQQPMQGYPQQMQPSMPQGFSQPGQMQQGRQNLQIVNTPHGQMVVDVLTNQIIGPVPVFNNQQYSQPRQNNNFALLSQNALGHDQNNRFGSGAVETHQDYNIIEDNRYGQIQKLTKTESNYIMAEEPLNSRATSQPVAAVVSAPVVVNKGLSGVKYKPEHRTIPFKVNEIKAISDPVIGDSFGHVISDLIDMAHVGERKELVWIQPGVIVSKFYNTTIKAFENDLFQGDIEAVHKVLKQLLPEVNNRNDIVFYDAFVKWITEAINDFLRVAVPGELKIDSFEEDFNDLIKHLLSVNAKYYRVMIEHMNSIVSLSLLDVQSVREVDEDGNDIADVTIPDNVTVIPDRVSLVYIKLLSSEIGDDGTKEGLAVASRLMSSIEEDVNDSLFYMITLDRRIYKVSYIHDTTVNIECISG